MCLTSVLKKKISDYNRTFHLVICMMINLCVKIIFYKTSIKTYVYVRVLTIIKGRPVYQYVWHTKEPHCPMAMSTEHMLNFTTLHRQRCLHHMSETWDSKSHSNKQA